MDIFGNLPLVFERNLLKKLTMFNAHIRTRRYVSATRGIPQPQLSRRVQEQGAVYQMRRFGDFVIACVFLAITLPLMIIVASAIKWESPGPILVRQTCIGRGRRFQMLRFRTIVHDPEHAMPAWAQKTTRVGQLLRHTRIDVLPQLFNVLRGEMSIIDSGAGSPSFLD
jgi:lipopolysaccharide/colanic/teichoic acid biosynthesis glycosyltransferase